MLLVLGSKIGQNGELSERAMKTVQKAVDLYRQGVAPRIVFSGKWSYKEQGDLPITEAAAMAKFARTLGVPQQACVLEEESYNTVANGYFTKVNVLAPNNWKSVLLITVEVVDKRVHLTVSKILGPEYICDVVLADFSYPPQHREELQILESEKLSDVKKFLAKYHDGDHEGIMQGDIEYQQKRGFLL